MKARTIYIVTSHTEPKDRAGGKYFTSEGDLNSHMGRTGLYRDRGKVVYKIECDEAEEYRILEALRNGEKVNLARYKNVSAAVYMTGTEPLFKPLKIKREEDIHNVSPNANRMFREAASPRVPTPQRPQKNES